MRTLILSDLHLGSRNCHAGLITEILERERFDRLILNGDTLHSINLRKLTPKHWGILNWLRQLARSREMILLRGNHDHECDYTPSATGHPNGDANGTANGEAAAFGSNHVLPALLDVPMIEEYQLEIKCRPYAVLHGDRFDPTLKNALASEMAGWCYQFAQKVNKKLAKWLKKKSKRWSGVLEVMRRRSVAYARERGTDGIITGHTHFPEDLHIDDVHYLNTGCWTEPPCTYITVDPAGARLHHVPD